MNAFSPLERASGRLRAALERLDRAARALPAAVSTPAPPDPAMQLRHDTLKSASKAAVEQLDDLLSRIEKA